MKIAALALLVLIVAPLRADDWPQFRGPLRDGVSRETNLLKSWPEGGPKQLWLSTNLGTGYSGPAIAGGRIFILGQRADAQWLLFFDARDGKELWAERLGDHYANEFGDGPRVMVTPGDEVWSSKALKKGTVTIADEMMYCLTEDSGTVVLAEASPGGWKEHSRFLVAPQSERRALKAKVWTPPVIANGRIYLRDQEYLLCYQIFLDAAPSKTANLRQP